MLERENNSAVRVTVTKIHKHKNKQIKKQKTKTRDNNYFVRSEIQEKIKNLRPCRGWGFNT